MSEGVFMKSPAKKADRMDHKRDRFTDPLKPSNTEEQWRAQGWADEPLEMSAASQLDAIISVRFGAVAAATLMTAARQLGISQTEFVRRAAIAEAERVTTHADQAVLRKDRVASMQNNVAAERDDPMIDASDDLSRSEAEHLRPPRMPRTGTD